MSNPCRQVETGFDGRLGAGEGVYHLLLVRKPNRKFSPKCSLVKLDLRFKKNQERKTTKHKGWEYESSHLQLCLFQVLEHSVVEIVFPLRTVPNQPSTHCITFLKWQETKKIVFPASKLLPAGLNCLCVFVTLKCFTKSFKVFQREDSWNMTWIIILCTHRCNKAKF